MSIGRCRAEECDNYRMQYSVHTKARTQLIRCFPETAMARNFKDELTGF